MEIWFDLRTVVVVVAVLLIGGVIGIVVGILGREILDDRLAEHRACVQRYETLFGMEPPSTVAERLEHAKPISAVLAQMKEESENAQIEYRYKFHTSADTSEGREAVESARHAAEVTGWRYYQAEKMAIYFQVIPPSDEPQPTNFMAQASGSRIN